MENLDELQSPDTQNTKKLDDKILSFLSSFNLNITSSPDEVWESLNQYFHNKFGFGEIISQKSNIVEIEKAKKLYSAFLKWKHMNPYVELIKNNYMKLLNATNDNGTYFLLV